MATLTVKAYLVASLNIMVAARQVRGAAQAFHTDEIVEILVAMSENSTIAAEAYSIPKTVWPGPPENLL